VFDFLKLRSLFRSVAAVVVGVHIADVAAFVASGSGVDREARVRGYAEGKTSESVRVLCLCQRFVVLLQHDGISARSTTRHATCRLQVSPEANQNDSIHINLFS
jgi:hypothetical protein